ncbi:MAG: hypothetical protein ABIK25_11755 [Pseudomonadota bacterium]
MTNSAEKSLKPAFPKGVHLPTEPAGAMLWRLKNRFDNKWKSLAGRASNGSPMSGSGFIPQQSKLSEEFADGARLCPVS